MGQEFNFSIIQFNLAFEFIDREYTETREYTESACDCIEPFFSHYPDIWKEKSIDGDHYDPSTSRSFYLKDPNSHFVQRFLVYNYSSHKDSSGILSKLEFFFI